MGLKKVKTDKSNTGGEKCQLKTATTANVVISRPSPVFISGYMMPVGKPVTASYSGACIEGAVRTASAAFTVMATVYMMA